MGTPREATHGFVAPLRLEPGVRALVVGRGGSVLARALGERGARVLALDPDEGPAETAEGATAEDGGVDVRRCTLGEWLLGEGASDPGFDLLACADVGADGHDVRDGLAALLDEASALLRPSGMLLVGMRNPRGLSALLGMDEATREVQGGAALDRAALHATLASHGFVEERWFVPYPGPSAPAVIVDASLWERPDGAAIGKTLVRKPVSGASLVPPATDPLGAFHGAVDAGQAADIADAYLVAASRGGQQGGVTSRDGLAWLVPLADPRPEWLLVRELYHADGAWQIRPAGSLEAGFSGPLAREALAARLPIGLSGEDLVSDVLISQGPFDPGAGALLRAWWTSAQAAFAASPSGQLQYDVLPRNFVVASDGEWRFIPQDLTWRFPLPMEVLAYRALRETLSRAVLPRGRVKDLPASLSLDEAVRRIMDSMEVRSGEEFTYLWAELETEIAARLSRVSLDQVAHKKALLAAGAETLWARAFDLPLDTQMEALRTGDLARDARDVRRELETLRADEAAARWQLVDREAELEQVGHALERHEAELEQTRKELDRRDAELERLRDELVRCQGEARASAAREDGTLTGLQVEDGRG